jgi:hypothetical protein
MWRPKLREERERGSAISLGLADSLASLELQCALWIHIRLYRNSQTAEFSRLIALWTPQALALQMQSIGG